MRKKKMMVLFLVLAMVLTALSGCGSSDKGSEPQGDSDTGKGGLVVMAISNQQNEFIVGMGESFKKVGAENGYEVQLVDADNDPTKQLSQIESAIAQGAVAIFLEPCSFDGLTNGLEQAKEAGIPVFTIHNGVSATDLITSAIRVDVKAGGAQKMQHCMDQLGGKGNIAIMTGTTGQDTTNQICGGYDEVLKNYPDIKVLYTGAADWGATKATPLAENWIAASGDQLDAIVCNNDGMAMGVIPVLSTTGKTGDILLYGLDATKEGLKAVKNGEMTATIYVDAHGEIVKAFELLDTLQQGGTVDSEYVIPTVLIDSTNVDEYLK
jgi:ribose transport system substrate-binding protein/inositol transport system substrate-binding protein